MVVRDGQSRDPAGADGAHPDFRTEWWYVTGWVTTPDGEELGFQVTFFRFRNPGADANPSRFSPKQLLFAHAALADSTKGRLLADQRSARVVEGVAYASTADTDVAIDDWRLAREGAGYRTHIAGESFALELDFAPTQRVMLQGDRGFSRKGSNPAQASYYYSEPQLRASSSPMTPWGGIGSARTWTTAARSWRFASAARMAPRCGRARPTARQMARRRRTDPRKSPSRRAAHGSRRARAA